MTRRYASLGAVLLLVTSIAGATTLTKMSFSDLVREADYIVVGTVTGIQGQWDESARFVHSDVTLSVERSLIGYAPEQIVLRTPGGEVGGTAMKAHGAPSFALHEKVLVFLTAWEDGTPKVLGYVQGKSRVIDEDGQPRLQGGVAGGRTLEGVAREIQRGPDDNIPLRPAR